MTTQTATKNQTKQDLTLDEKIQKLRELYADAPEVGRAALKNGLPMITQELAAPSQAQTAGRIGARQGKVSELTIFLPFVPGGAKRLRGLLQLMEGNFKAADAVGTVHDMRFVFVDNDTKLLFATAYDGDFDPYIEDFAAKIPNAMGCAIARGTQECVTRRRRRTGSPSTRSRPMPGTLTVRT